jgi:DNA mismatch repair protein MutL
VAEAVTLLALARPETGFSLRSGGRTVLETPPVDGLAARLFQLFGAVLLEDLAPVEGGADWASVRGFVSRPDRPRPPRPNLRLFVNRRAVRDRALSKAVLEAYRAAGTGERGFEAFLFVELPAHLVDVNVHPAKTEVRFAEARTVFAAVQRAVREGLAEGVRQAPSVSVARSVESVADGARAATARFLDGADAEPAAARQLFPAAGTGASVAAEGRGAEDLGAAALTVLGQHRLVYIVASDGDELVLVDQHTAHERVRFEQLLARAERRMVESQGLLVPAVVELPPSLRPVLDANSEGLRELGYDVEPFGGSATRLRAVPAVLGTRDPGPALAAILRDLAEREAADWAVSDVRDRLAATLACHSAVRAGQALGLEPMSAIVRDLMGTKHRTLCPHGRPTLVRVPKDELSRWFGRTGWRRQ